jgi:RimJ/RimL family protein N-acetyltransferase
MTPATVKILQPGDEPALEAFLLPHLDSSMFLLSNMRSAGLANHGARYQGTYAAVFERGAITGVVAHFWNKNIILQAPVRHLDTLWQAVLKASQSPIGGLIGPARQVEAVKCALNIAPVHVQLDETENLYTLNLAGLKLPEALGTSEVKGRRIGPADVDLLTAWRVGFSVEALGEKESPRLWAGCQTAIKCSLKEQTMWVLEHHGQPVACTAFNSAVKEAVQVGGVWTPPDLRGRGYARCAVAASLLDARAEGVKKAILFTGVKNTPAQKAYLALGFQHVGDYRILLLRPPLKNRWGNEA